MQGFGRRPRRKAAAARKVGKWDLVQEVTRSAIARPGQTLTTAVGSIVGVAAGIATVGLTLTGQIQVAHQFDVLKATEVRVTAVPSNDDVDIWPLDPDQALAAIDGVSAGGGRMQLDGSPGLAIRHTATPTSHSSHPVLAVSAGYLKAAQATAASGRMFDNGHVARHAKVAVVGIAAARTLGIAEADGTQMVMVDDEPFAIIGIVESVARDHDLLLSVMIPTTTAHDAFAARLAGERMLVTTRIGAAQIVGRQIPVALSPTQSQRYAVSVPPEPEQLRQRVSVDLGGLTAALAAVSLGLGALTIGNTVLASVRERAGEIGLRQALGARRRDVAALFLLESTGIGLLGGVIGTGIGVTAVVAVSGVRDWSPVIHPILIMAGPSIGMSAGLLAGIYPALAASRLEPVAALAK